MTCPRCQYETPADAEFCPECGAKLVVLCAQCGTANAPGHKFCKKCGQRLGTASAQAPDATGFASPKAYTPKHLAEKILTSKAALEGERKQVTVLFADLKGSMELLADRDPEEARKLLDPVLEHMMEAVHRYEGTVNQVMGDGIMALFGAPLAHEDHAILACYAALRMQDAIRRYTEGLRRAHGIEVQIRIGLNSGEVVVRSIGSDLRMDYTAVGQTTHLAARMEQLAAPGTIRLTAETLALAEGYVEVRPLGPVPVKGLADPVEVYELAGAGTARTRLQAARVRGLTRFVGRDAEMSEITRAAQEARRGRGQVVAVVGEPGVGKSRLFYEFVHSHHTHGWRVLESGPVSYGKATPYLPVTDLLRAYFRVETNDDVRAIQAKVTGNILTLDEARLFPDLEYTFKHALTHEVAYGSLLSDRRQALHAALVGAIERLHAGRLEEHVERLAHHALRGDLRSKAARYLHQAGDRAAARSANREAAALFGQAVPLLDGLPDTPETLAETADVHLALATTLTGIRGTGSPDVEVSHLRARELAERLGDPIRLYQALWGLWFVNYGRGRYSVAREMGEQLLAIAERENDTGRLVEAHHSLWATMGAMGEAIAARPHCERGIALYDPARHASQAFSYGGHDAGACCRYHLARAQWFLGYPARAVAGMRDALDLSETLAHPQTMAITLGSAACLRYHLGEWQAAQEHARRMQAIAEAHGFAALIDDAVIVLVCAGVRGGTAGGLEKLYDRLMTATIANRSVRRLTSLVILANAALAIGDPERALGALDSIPVEHREIFAPEIRRIRGDILLRRGQRDEAEQCFGEAIAIARRRSERLLELRATTSLARLLDGQGRHDDARRSLAEIYAWFTEGFDTADLRAARALLDELGGPIE